MRRGLIALMLLAACEPQSRRLLLVDLAFTDPLVIEGTAAPWSAVGYDVEYRRHYPHLSRQDLSRYHAVIVLGGREPEAASDALTLGDLAILTEWLADGRVVVFGYSGDGEGSGDRWVVNRWLASLGAGIAIGDDPLVDSAAAPRAPRALPMPQSALDRAGYQPFTATRHHALVVRSPSQVLARAGAPVVAASRVARGLLVIASRHTLAVPGPDLRATNLPPVLPAEEMGRTRVFLEALARWTRRPAEWAAVAPGEDGVPLELTGAPRPVPIHPPPLAPPAGAGMTSLPRPSGGLGGGGTELEVPGWIARQGMRALWSRWPYRGVDSLLTFLDVGGFNVWATVVPSAALYDSLGSRAAWRLLAERLQVTSLRWFPTLALGELRAPPSLEVPPARELDLRGKPAGGWCALDEVFWRSMLRPAYRTLARLGGGRGEPVAGVALDLDLPAGGYAAAGFCDATYREGLSRLGLDSVERARLVALPPPVRYDSLLERGLLDAYYDALERAVVARAAALRTELRALAPDLRFAFRSAELPVDWFTVGLLRGFSSGDAPALLWTRERRTRGLLARYRERGAVLLSGVTFASDAVAPGDWPRLRRLAFGEHDGFLLTAAETGEIPADSLARLVRRLAR